MLDAIRDYLNNDHLTTKHVLLNSITSALITALLVTFFKAIMKGITKFFRFVMSKINKCIFLIKTYKRRYIDKKLNLNEFISLRDRRDEGEKLTRLEEEALAKAEQEMQEGVERILRKHKEKE